MAQVILNCSITGLRGRIGDIVYRRYGAKTFASRRPRKSRAVATTAQVAQQARFRGASDYAAAVTANPERAAVYQHYAARAKCPLRAIAMRDYLRAPVIKHIDVTEYTGRAGDRIDIEARDDTQVVAVHVVLRTRAGVMIEEGAAEVYVGWRYITKTRVARRTVIVEATATDLAGNRVTRKGTVKTR
jgi:hypothetical protein